MKSLLLALGIVAHAGAAAQALALPPRALPGLQQRLGAQLPLHAVFFDEHGRRAALGTYFGAQPVVLVLGYYHCPNLCSTLMDGVLESLADARMQAGSFRVLGVSIDASETPELALRRQMPHTAPVERAGGELHMLTGEAPQIRALARAAGFQYAYDARSAQFSHPAAFMVATPDGRIAHYFTGVRFEPRDLRLALVDASAGRIGSPVDRLLLLCSHYDPATGRYSTAAVALVRAAGLSVLAALVALVWRLRGRRRA